MGPEITVYTSRTCPVCGMVKQFLDDNGFTYTEVPVDLNPLAMLRLIARRGRFTVPQTEVNGVWIGGFDPVRMLKVMNTD